MAAPLIALAAPIMQVLRAASPEARRRWLLPALHSTPAAAFGHPVVAWLTFTLAGLRPRARGRGRAYAQARGGIMWLAGDVIFIAAVLVIVAAWMRHADRDAPAADRRADADRARIRERADQLA